MTTKTATDKKPATKSATKRKPAAKKAPVAKAEKQTLTIDGQEYALDALSENARNQLVNLRVTDQEIARLQQQLAIAQTARTAYANALKQELPQQEH